MHERDKKSIVDAIIETHTLCHTYYHIEDTLSTWGNGALNPGLKSADFHSPFPSYFFFPSPLLIPWFLFLCNMNLARIVSCVMRDFENWYNVFCSFTSSAMCYAL